MNKVELFVPILNVWNVHNSSILKLSCRQGLTNAMEVIINMKTLKIHLLQWIRLRFVFGRGRTCDCSAV